MTFLRFCDPHLMAVPSHGGDGDPQFQTSQYFTLHIGSSEKHIFFSERLRLHSFLGISLSLYIHRHRNTTLWHDRRNCTRKESRKWKKDVAFNTCLTWLEPLRLQTHFIWWMQSRSFLRLQAMFKVWNFLISWSFRLWREQWDLVKNTGCPWHWRILVPVTLQTPCRIGSASQKWIQSPFLEEMVDVTQKQQLDTYSYTYI